MGRAAQSLLVVDEARGGGDCLEGPAAQGEEERCLDPAGPGLIDGRAGKAEAAAVEPGRVGGGNVGRGERERERPAPVVPAVGDERHAAAYAGRPAPAPAAVRPAHGSARPARVFRGLPPP